MSTELSVNLVCVLMRSGVQIWLEKERAENLRTVLRSIHESKFIDLDSNFINTADISGIFTAEDMEDWTRRKNWQWKCNNNVWHDRGEKCECLSAEQIANREKLKKEYAEKYGEGFMPSM